MNLEQALTNWDGKSTDFIEEIYQRHAALPDFISELPPLIAQEATQAGATWLLKHHLETNYLIDQATINAIYQMLPKQTEWAAKLHLLQCIPYLPIAPATANSVHTFLQACVADDKKFVRAWAYNGFYVLACQHPQFLPEMRQLLSAALIEEAASVKARIRNIVKQDAKGPNIL